jgi:MFS family permease
MTAKANGAADPGVSAADLRTVVTASAAGTAFEWYDFFIFVPLTAIIAKTFAAGLTETAGLVFALGSFAAGFAFRPVGALIFGRVGDRAGRKGAFLITITLMGFATFAIGLLPTYANAGIISPILFIGLRLIQGIALGGEWGGAAVYMAEHTRAGQRGGLTSWLGASAGFGLAAALLVVLATRTVLGEAAFADWGWRVPFLASIVLFAASVYIRLKLHESPAFQQMKDEGRRSDAPYTESFLRWRNLKIVLIALFAIMVAQGAVWYTTFFYAQVFIERVIKVAPATVNQIILAVVVFSAPLYVFFGWLSDRVGRKPVMAGGMIVFALTTFWGFHQITHFGNPALAEASARAPVTVIADPASCTLQFDPVGKAKFRSSCDIAKSTLANAGVSYTNQAAPKGSLAMVKVGSVEVPSAEGGSLDAAGLKALKAGVEGRLKAALKAAGYPDKADPARTNAFGIFVILMIFAVGATALYGPQAAALVEMFPTRIRYTALSLPYHIGTGWVGGFLPATVFAMVAASGDIYFGLWYPVLATLLSVAVTLVLLPETRHRDLNTVE